MSSDTFENNAAYKRFAYKEGSYLPSNRNSPESERIENAPLAILISTGQFNSMLVLGSSGENALRIYNL